jgi:Arc/MetJ-type ribon-helix-helix transcriptional regulator
MTIRTTLSFTDRHHSFLVRKVEEGVFASTSAAVAAAVEAMIEDEIAREAALAAMSDQIRARMETPQEEHLDLDEAFGEARALLARGRGEVR